MPGSLRARATRMLGIIAAAVILAGLADSSALSAEPGAIANEKKTVPAADRPAPAPPAKSPDAGTLGREAWRALMARTPRPKKGCFTAAYPDTQWKEVPCTTAPRRPYQPAGGPGPHTVGRGVDFSARTTGLITKAVGSFDSLASVTSVTSDGTLNKYSLQLNTIQFHTSACDSSPNAAGCLGFQQFIYSNTGTLFMQLWLLGFGADCPTGFFHFPNRPTDCSMNSDSVTVPVQPLANLGQLSLSGEAAAGGLDTITLSTGDQFFSATVADASLELSQHWTAAEFNIFGDCCSSEVTFNTGASMAVRTSIDDGTTNAPLCLPAGFTAETNSLTLVRPCCPFGGESPAIVFRQSSNSGATSQCANGTSIGDTHLTNFNGLLFDFQAAGDFLLAETGADFVVQTRQKSGAPRWPNATINTAVAVKGGKTRAALCLEPDALVVDGRRRVLDSGGSLSLPGLVITRKENVYVFKHPDGASAVATRNNGWINVSVHLGGNTPVAKVRGLLGNANGNTGADDLAARGGAVLPRPVTFQDLYHRYGDSWRVSASDSLPAELCGGGNIESGNPRSPFYAKDLTPAQYNRARASCVAAGVHEQPLLDACSSTRPCWETGRRPALSSRPALRAASCGLSEAPRASSAAHRRIGQDNSRRQRPEYIP